jgi:hypothetical protein
MKSPSMRSSENALFAVLIAAVIGWSAASVAARQAAPVDPAACKLPGVSARHGG